MLWEEDVEEVEDKDGEWKGKKRMENCKQTMHSVQ